jgi:hypothetical protein
VKIEGVMGICERKGHTGRREAWISNFGENSSFPLKHKLSTWEESKSKTSRHKSQR